MFKFIQKILFCLLLIITTSHAAPFQNGSFENNSALWENEGGGNPNDHLPDSEQDLTGWLITNLNNNNYLQWFKSSPSRGAPQNGDYFIEHCSGWTARLSQIFDTISGQEYQVSFYYKPYN
ncbi:MAG: hypothetical protein ACJAXL_000924, partial [Alphaproteobacteria bacterium]